MEREKRYNLSPELKIGFLLLAILIFLAVFGPQIAPYRPGTFTDDLLHPPSRQYLFGTDGLGRDVYSLVLYGTRTSLRIGILAASISMLIGTTIGALSGYYGGVLDKIVSELINIFLMLPTLFLIIMVVAIFGSSIDNVIIVIGVTSWMGTARLMRAQTISLKERTFVRAARVIGEGDFMILIRHIIPNGIFPVLANVTMSISSAILYEASLSFIGLGDPTVVSWGQIIYNGRNYMSSGWWVATCAGLGIVITVFAFHLISEGINRLLNPNLGRR